MDENFYMENIENTIELLKDEETEDREKMEIITSNPKLLENDEIKEVFDDIIKRDEECKNIAIAEGLVEEKSKEEKMYELYDSFYDLIEETRETCDFEKLIKKIDEVLKKDENQTIGKLYQIVRENFSIRILTEHEDEDKDFIRDNIETIMSNKDFIDLFERYQIYDAIEDTNRWDLVDKEFLYELYYYFEDYPRLAKMPYDLRYEFIQDCIDNGHYEVLSYTCQENGFDSHYGDKITDNYEDAMENISNYLHYNIKGIDGIIEELKKNEYSEEDLENRKYSHSSFLFKYVDGKIYIDPKLVTFEDADYPDYYKLKDLILEYGEDYIVEDRLKFSYKTFKYEEIPIEETESLLKDFNDRIEDSINKQALCLSMESEIEGMNYEAARKAIIEAQKDEENRDKSVPIENIELAKKKLEQYKSGKIDINKLREDFGLEKKECIYEKSIKEKLGITEKNIDEKQEFNREEIEKRVEEKLEDKKQTDEELKELQESINKQNINKEEDKGGKDE